MNTHACNSKIASQNGSQKVMREEWEKYLLSKVQLQALPNAMQKKAKKEPKGLGKSLMMIPVDQDGRCLGLDSSNEPQSIISQNLITRKAGGRREAERKCRVIVDMREFMSTLPNVLHQKSMRVEMMSRYYRILFFLLSFHRIKAFPFQSASEIGDDVTPNSIISKLSLLVLHFPRLRIIWSRSLHATAEIFASLKSNQDEPDEVKAIRVGVPSEEGVVENDVRAENYNTCSRDVEAAARRDRFQLQGNNGRLQKPAELAMLRWRD
ncbi:hypothetical protein HAX54_010840 [Datura stramonium]|uniref:DNA repair endonuclease UVH1 n=1 Tax=Datura stramonium TaxID=4076 RepID=A0ABS8TJM0_DATST|nr:hypothetical protein [Datura stramonium]